MEDESVLEKHRGSNHSVHQRQRKDTIITKRRGAPNKGNVSDNKVEKFKP